jgi:Ca-activated chloride channel family protein
MVLIPRRFRMAVVGGRLFAAASVLVAAASVLTVSASAPPVTPLSVKITSPLGRMGTSGKVRIVAQIHAGPGTTLKPIRFYVDNVLLGVDDDGPPYAVEWFDENPYERREISVEVEDDLGHVVRDSVELKPFEIVEVTGVSRVLLEASVYDKAGRFVSSLPRSSFTVTEDGVPQEIDLVNQETLPATFALLIDSSHSMSRRIDFVRDAASRFIQYLRPKDQVLVAPFTRGLGALTGPTADRKTILDAVGHIGSDGGTAILDSLVEVVKKLPADQGRCAVVLITDGYDENSVTSAEDALAAVKSARATVYVVGIGGIAGISLKGERLLKRIAAETGGQVFFPPREEDIVAVHERLAEDAQNRYLVTYTPSNQTADGAWRSVKMTTAPDYKVRTRDGYRAPRPPPVHPELEFTITDAEQRYVDLSADDLVVVEDGVEQAVDAFHEAVAPVSIVLALDASGSMRRSAAAVVEAAHEFVAALRPEDSLAPMLFADQAVFAHDLTTNREAASSAIDSYQATGGTALYDALADALSRLKRVEGRRAIVVMTDGRDENNPGTAPGSLRTLNEVIAQVKETDATIFAIGLGVKVDRAPLEQLARLSGGQAFFPAEISGLQDEYRRIVENLRRRYVLSYTSTNIARDGAWRDVQIRSRSSDIVVTSRGGYFAPER